MKILAFETSTPNGGAAIIDGGRVLGEEISRRQRSHSELLHVFVAHLLTSTGLRLSDFDAFAVGQGPGSFTGIRVAADAGKAFAAALERPLITIDTLTQIASRSVEKSDPVLVLINAFKNMVYYGLFDVQGPEPVYLKGPGAVALDAIESILPPGPVTVVGDGWALCQKSLRSEVLSRMHRGRSPVDEPSPATLGVLAHERLRKGLSLDWKSFTPLYLRASEAEENERGALFRAGKDSNGERG